MPVGRASIKTLKQEDLRKAVPELDHLPSNIEEFIERY